MGIFKDKNRPYAPKILIYGPPSVGKSTFALNSPKPIFLSVENGIDGMHTEEGECVDEFNKIKSWNDIVNCVNWLISNEHDFKTIVIDSIDEAERFAHEKITGGKKVDITRVNGGYGAGHRESEAMHFALKRKLDELYEKKNMNIILISHSEVKEMKDPIIGEKYNYFDLRCHKFVSDLWKQSCSACLFLNFETKIITNDKGENRALGGDKRMIYTQKSAGYEAKNRFNLPPKMNFSKVFWKDLEPYVKSGQKPVKPDEIKANIVSLLAGDEDEKIDQELKEKIMKNTNETNEVSKLLSFERRVKKLLES